MQIKYLKQNLAKVRNKTVLLRLDLNEPVSKDGQLLDDYRIRASLPTIKLLLDNECKIIICAHLGRPRGKKIKRLSLAPIVSRLAQLLGKHLELFSLDIRSLKNRKILTDTLRYNIVCLENVRYYLEEEKNNQKFAKALASLAEVYVDDAFGSVHRKEASIVGVPKYIPSFAGPLIAQEVAALDYVLLKAGSPKVVLTGGIKIKDKIQAIAALAKTSDKLLLGGGVANLILKTRGFEIGVSAIEKGGVNTAKLLDKTFHSKIVLPLDFVVTDSKMSKASIRLVDVHNIKPRDRIVDVGPKTILAYSKILKTAKTIIWNGPLGQIEVKPFDTATMSLAKVIGGVSKRKAYGLIGGGETIDGIRQAGQEKFIDHISTGGGAMLAYLAGVKLPGLEILK